MAEQMAGPDLGPGALGGGTYHNSIQRELREAKEFLATRLGSQKPTFGVVLGSGLGAFAEQMGEAIRVPYAEIPHMPTMKVSGHAGWLCMGDVGGVTVACLQGRSHLYEGHPVHRVVFGCRLLAALGCHSVVLTNAAGGIRGDLGPGSFMLISDHLNLTGHNPLAGFVDSFTDMSRAYDAALGDAARDAAADVGVGVADGVYAGLLGPSYETPAEIRMLRALGADAVGMSTVCETIALRHAGVRVGALSCITNWAAGVSVELLDHSEVRDVAARVERHMVRLLRRWLQLGELQVKGNSE